MCLSFAFVHVLVFIYVGKFKETIQLRWVPPDIIEESE